MVATIRIEAAVRDRLRAYGAEGMTLSDILIRLMDEIDRRPLAKASGGSRELDRECPRLLRGAFGDSLANIA